MPENSLLDDAPWQKWRVQWPIRPDTVYLNHGSFGPPPRAVIAAQRNWQDELACQPMDFFVRTLEPAWIAARDRLARFLSADPEDLAFVENASAGMNVVADSFPLQAGDEVLFTDHEYGAVVRIWERACDKVGAWIITAQLPTQFNSVEEVVASIFVAATERTKIVVISHITSPTAVILPVVEICREAHRRGIAICIDGPHAPAQTSLAFDELDCDFYVASLHKWVSAPFGSGFIFVAPKWHSLIRTPLLCWGRVSPTKPVAWWDEFLWTGTRDPSAYLATTAALDLLEHEVGLEAFRTRTHALARYAREQIVSLTELEPPTADSSDWYGSMISCPLLPGDARELMRTLWEKHQIEIPVVEHNGNRSIRVSCHLYTNQQDIDYLVNCLKAELSRSVPLH